MALAMATKRIKPTGGTICIQSASPGATNHADRTQGIRDALGGDNTSIPRLSGQNGWTEVDGCPLYTNYDFPLAVQQVRDVLATYPDLDAFVSTGGFAQFAPDAYRDAVMPYKERVISSELALVFADAMPSQIDLMKEGLSSGQVGERPFDMGYNAMYALSDFLQDGTLPVTLHTGPDIFRPDGGQDAPTGCSYKYCKIDNVCKCDSTCSSNTC